MDNPIKVLIVDDHPLVRRGVTVCLGRHKGIKIVGETGDSREVLSLAEQRQPNVILMDIGMPYMSGTEVTALLRRELPQVRVLVLSIHEDPETVRQARQAGACGYILKGIACAELIRAVETVFGGELYFKPERGPSLRPGQEGDVSRLTEREREVFIQMAEGGSNKDIAARLGIAARTVEGHRGSIKGKLKSAADFVR